MDEAVPIQWFWVFLQLEPKNNGNHYPKIPFDAQNYHQARGFHSIRVSEIWEHWSIWELFGDTISIFGV